MNGIAKPWLFQMALSLSIVPHLYADFVGW
jgi:hypothetical protein